MTFGQSQNLKSSWHEWWISVTHKIKEKSKDRSTKVGAVIMDDDQCPISYGWNGFPRGLDDNVEARHERPAKYNYTEHAERNAIYNAARTGHKTKGTRIYVASGPDRLFCCSPCARAIIQAGIKEVIMETPDWENPRWKDDCAVAKEMLDECGVKLTFI